MENLESFKTIFIADANTSYCTRLANELDSQPGMKVVGVAANGFDAVNRIEALAPDVVVMDIVLPRLDGMGVLRTLNQKKLPKTPVVVVMSFFVTEMLEMHAASLGAQYFLVKPFETTDLVEFLNQQAVVSQGAHVHDDTKSKITEFLREMGIPSHIKGFLYAREAIVLTMDAPEANYGITKYIYPQIAIKYGTTPSRVERAIRHAIEVGWTRGDIGTHYSLFRNSVSSDRGKPTNSEFIATLADSLLMDGGAVQPRPLHSTGMRA